MKIKALSKKAIAFPLTSIFPADRYYNCIKKKGLTVLTYHRITTTPGRLYPQQWGMFVEKKSFAWQMDYLLSHYSIVSLKDVVNAVIHGNPLPDNPVMITFDDGYRDNYLHAYPVLKQRHIPAVIFATSGFADKAYVPWADRYYMVLRVSSLEKMKQALNRFTGNPDAAPVITNDALFADFAALSIQQRNDLLSQLEEQCHINSGQYAGLICSWNELRELNKNGISIEGHTASHPPSLPVLDAEQIKTEILSSKNAIEMRLNKTVTAMAFPEGRFDQRVLAAVKESGLSIAFSTVNGINDPETIRARRYHLKRFGIGLTDTHEVYRLKASGFWKKNLQLRVPPQGHYL